MPMKNVYRGDEHPFAPYIRIIGKGKTGARSLTFEEAEAAMGMILRGEVLDVQLGAFLMLLRVKEETSDELAGFVAAARQHIAAPRDMPVDLDWSSYAGKRKHYPWFLFAVKLLVQNGVRIFMHGASGHTVNRLYTENVLPLLGLAQCRSWTDVRSTLERDGFDALAHGEPAAVVLAAVEQELADKPGREQRLAAKLSRLRKEYDYVLIDCPPSIGLLTFNALAASNETIIPVDPSFFSLHGLHRVRETIELLRDEVGHEIHIRILANNYNSRTNFSRDILYEIENFHGDSMLKTTISHTVKLKEAASRGQPIVKFEAGNRASKEFLALADEILAQEPFFKVAERRDYEHVFSGPQLVSGGVRFTIEAPHTQDVRVTGEFSSWSYEGITLEPGPDGIWSRVIEVPPGAYEYRFILDGVWVKDPNNLESVTNDYGQENSVVVV